MIVVYSATRNLYPYLNAAIGSLLEHNDARVIVLAEDDDIACKYPVDVINVSDQTYFPPNSANYNGAFTYMSMMRLMYVDLLPGIDRVIQLDVDTIVCDSLLPIWEMDLTGKWFAACPEYRGNYHPFGDDPSIRYYNVGVMVVNIEQMRNDGMVPDMVDYLNRVRLWCTEQDVLNLFATEHRKAADIPVRFNETQFTGESATPAVVHYAGYPRWYDANVPRSEYLKAAREKHG